MRSFKFFKGFESPIIQMRLFHVEQELIAYLSEEINNEINNEINDEILRDLEAITLQEEIEREYNLRMIA